MREGLEDGGGREMVMKEGMEDGGGERGIGGWRYRRGVRGKEEAVGRIYKRNNTKNFPNNKGTLVLKRLFDYAMLTRGLMGGKL